MVNWHPETSHTGEPLLAKVRRAKITGNSEVDRSTRVDNARGYEIVAVIRTVQASDRTRKGEEIKHYF